MSSARHSTLAQRLLFHPSSTPSPPALLASTANPELNGELYDFIALALRAYVNPWWTKITRHDKQFLPHITVILTHVFRQLEPRLADADLPLLLFNDLPILLTQHFRDYRNAAAKVSTSYANGGAIQLPSLFHQLQPHMAVTPDGTLSDEYFRQIFDHILKLSMPEEDSCPETQRTIIREVLLKVLLRDVIPKLSQPWFITKIILDNLPQPAGPKADPSLEDTPTRASRSSQSNMFSFHTIIVFFLSAIQSVSGFALALIHASKRARQTISEVNLSPPLRIPSRPLPNTTSAPPLHTLPPSPPLSPTSSKTSSASSSRLSRAAAAISPDTVHHEQESDDAYDYDFIKPSLVMISEIFTTEDRLAASTLIHLSSGISAAFSPFLNRLLPYLLVSARSSQTVTGIVRAAKRTLFPNGYPAPAPPDPTPEEQAAMRARLLSYQPTGAGSLLSPLLLGADPETTLANGIEPLSSQACNIHLIVLILDRIISLLFPELCN
ncbi:PXA domain-containing protein [Pterulicium gracile]|uniref:PXA domain-containing protein n=1 Tax=Pterulicium gracile TaxID=1884261 RepID=A0A5C3QYM6_9AGAR|nr:PXA domain-containing protein [Pterula gracilis]